jgi:hypothetical protein
MANKLGSPQTTKFSIGTAEFRIGRLEDAMKLTQSHSVGLIDNATVEVTQESVDLEGGFPKVLVDTAVVSQTANITATLREYSRRNLQILLGEGVVDIGGEPADVSTTVDTGGGSQGATAVPVVSETGITAGDIVVIYGQSDATLAEVQVLHVQSVSAGSLTLDSDTPLLFDVVSGDHVYLSSQVAIGAITQTNYFSCQLLQLERASGRPIGFDFWKGSIGAGMTFATNAEDFASTEMNIKLLQPSATEYAAAQDPLYHLRDIIPSNPTGMYFGGGD